MVEEDTERNTMIGNPKTLEMNSKSNSSQSKVVGTPLAKNGRDLTTQGSARTNVKITMEDVQDEIEYWSIVVIFFVLGSNPLQSMMDGYFRRI